MTPPQRAARYESTTDSETDGFPAASGGTSSGSVPAKGTTPKAGAAAAPGATIARAGSGRRRATVAAPEVLAGGVSDGVPVPAGGRAVRAVTLNVVGLHLPEDSDAAGSSVIRRASATLPAGELAAELQLGGVVLGGGGGGGGGGDGTSGERSGARTPQPAVRSHLDGAPPHPVAPAHDHTASFGAPH